MPQKKFLLSTEKISKDISYFTIGFATLSVKGNVEDARCAGSGTLVTVGSLYGILTAAHVLDNLPKKGQVGLVTHADDPSRFQKQVIAMEHTDSVVMRGTTFDQKGPDLGFLRLPQESVGWITAKNSFYNLNKHRADVLAGNEPTQSHVDAVTGMIHELTTEEPPGRPKVRRISFTAIFCGAHLAALRYLTNYELHYFELTNDPGFALPQSFGGTSGGSTWRFYVAEKDDEITVVDRRLVGVPFFQSLTYNGKREITCHGPKGIYGSFIDAIAERWPKEALATSEMGADWRRNFT
jgi:hypothetical protein